MRAVCPTLDIHSPASVYRLWHRQACTEKASPIFVLPLGKQTGKLGLGEASPELAFRREEELLQAAGVNLSL